LEYEKPSINLKSSMLPPFGPLYRESFLGGMVIIVISPAA
jgi:hypothetical protein